MKKILFIAGFGLICFLSTPLAASTLSIRLFDNTTFNLVFDNESYNAISSNISLENVSPGKHFLKISRYRGTPYGHIFGMPRIIFEGIIHIHSGRTVYAMIDRYGRYFIEKEIVMNPPPVYIAPYMNESDFSVLKASIDRLSFESSKLTLAEQAISSNILTSGQVFEIMELFTFESSKLTFAELAYPHVYDKNKYYIVNNAFTFSSSITSLDSYIAQMN